MARIATLGSAAQSIYMIDSADLAPTEIGDEAVLGKVLVGHEIEIDKVLHGTSGAGVNTAITLARHGHEVILISNVANDSAGEAIISTLDHEEIDSSYMYFVEGRATGTSIVLLDSKSGRGTTLAYHGVSNRFNNLSANDLELIQPDYLLANSLNGEMDKYLEFFEKAREMDVKVVFRPGEAELKEPKKVLGLLADVDVLIMNKKAAGELVPGAILTELLYHLNNYVPLVVITDGAMGGIAGNRATGEVYRFGIYEDVKIKDKSGVSDGFAAGLVAHLAAKKNLRQSLIFASANATSIATKIGATSGVLTGNEDLHPMPIQKLN